MRRPWTEADDAWLRKLNAEGKNDGAIAYILTRTKTAVRRRRHSLGIEPIGRPGAPKGWKMPPAALAKSAEASRQRWKNPAYRAVMLLGARKGREKILRARFRRPPPGTDACKRYCKLRNVLGPERARQEMGL